MNRKVTPSTTSDVIQLLVINNTMSAFATATMSAVIDDNKLGDRFLVFSKDMGLNY